MATTYARTDNYGLNLYGDDDPADLRDGHNANMQKIDAALKTHSDEIAQNKTDVQANAATAAAAQATANTANATATAAQATANTANATATAAQATANTANATATAAQATANAAAPRSTTYTMAQVDSSQSAQDATIAAKADANSVYTKTESDENLSVVDGKTGFPIIAANGNVPAEAGVKDTRWYYGDLRRYGATPNSDVTAALNTALGNAYAGLCDVFIPPHSYTYSASITINPSSAGNFRIHGVSKKSVLTKTGAYFWKILDGASVEIDHLEFNGNGMGESGILIYSSKCYMHDLVVHDQGAHGIDVDGRQGGPVVIGLHHGDLNLIQHCHVYSCGQIGICTNDTTHADVMNNLVHDCGLEGITTDGTLYSKVTDNVIYNCCTHGGAGGISMDTTGYLVCTGNHVDGTQGGCDGIRMNNEGGPTHDCVIEANVLTNNTGRGIDGIAAYDVDNSVIMGNRMLNNKGGDEVALIGNSIAPCNFPYQTCCKHPKTGEGVTTPNTDLSTPAATAVNWFFTA